MIFYSRPDSFNGIQFWMVNRKKEHPMSMLLCEHRHHRFLVSSILHFFYETWTKPLLFPIHPMVAQPLL